MTDQDYQIAMRKVDKALGACLGGLGHRDLADFMSWDCIENGLSPLETAEACLDAQDYIPSEVYSHLAALGKRNAWLNEPAYQGE